MKYIVLSLSRKEKNSQESQESKVNLVSSKILVK